MVRLELPSDLDMVDLAEVVSGQIARIHQMADGDVAGSRVERVEESAAMNITLAEVVSWLTVGALAGYVIGLLLKRAKTTDTNHLANLGIGMVGALVGGFIFDALRIAEGLQEFRVTLRNVVAAVVGSLLFLGVIRIVKNQRSKTNRPTAG